jgi:hypothetical protein
MPAPQKLRCQSTRQEQPSADSMQIECYRYRPPSALMLEAADGFGQSVFGFWH